MSQTTTEILPGSSNKQAPHLPELQSQLLLHGVKRPYELHQAREIPKLLPGELLVQIQAIGLNPIDWKSAEYGFGLPTFPCVNGREFVGKVVLEHSSHRSDVNIGDIVLSVSTDYRDFRKSAFQEYAVINDFNVVRLPTQFDSPRAAGVGVAFVAASIALGVCLGLNFPRPKKAQSLDLLELARSQSRDEVPEDVRDEVFETINSWNRPNEKDWILVYGASSITAQVAIQLAKAAGLRVAAVADLSKHETRLRALNADKIFDRRNLLEAAERIRSEIPVPVRFALDTVGSETAAWCQDMLGSRVGVEHRASSSGQSGANAGKHGQGSKLPHLVCLTGSPKVKNANVQIHKVPIKLFHTNREVGHAVSEWLSELLMTDRIEIPETLVEDGGLEAIGSSLQRLKSGELSGKRLVIRL